MASCHQPSPAAWAPRSVICGVRSGSRPSQESRPGLPQGPHAHVGPGPWPAQDVQLWGGAAWPLSCLLSPPRPRVRSQLRVTQARARRGLWLSPGHADARRLATPQLRASKSWPCRPGRRPGPLLGPAGRGGPGPVTVKGFSRCAAVHTRSPSLLAEGCVRSSSHVALEGPGPGSPLLTRARGRGSGMVLGYAGPKVPSLCPARWPSPQARHPIITLLVSGGGWARASSPASKGSRTQGLGWWPPVRLDSCAAQGRPGRGPCVAPLCAPRWAGGRAAVPGQAVTRPAASCCTAPRATCVL